MEKHAICCMLAVFQAQLHNRHVMHYLALQLPSYGSLTAFCIKSQVLQSGGHQGSRLWSAAYSFFNLRQAIKCLCISNFSSENGNATMLSTYEYKAINVNCLSQWPSNSSLLLNKVNNTSVNPAEDD